MSAETIPADVPDDVWAIADLETRRGIWLPRGEVAQAIARAILADRSTRLAEPAAPVAEAGDTLPAVLDQFERAAMAYERLGKLTRDDEKTRTLRKGIIADLATARRAVAALMLSTLEAERARADELRRLLTASGRCVDDLTARLDAFEHAQEKARDEGFNHALSILEDALGSPTYYAADGSETWEGDTRGTIYNLLRASGVWRGDDDMLVTKDRDFWKERFQVESRSRIQAEQRAADALARAEKAEGEIAEAERREKWELEQAKINRRHHDAKVHSYVIAELGIIRIKLAEARVSREAQPATDGGEA